MRRKILFMELQADNWGHKQLDRKFIKALSDFCDVTVACQENWIDNLPTSIILHTYKMPNKIISHFKKIEFYANYYRWCTEHIKQALMLDSTQHFDYLFFSSYDSVISAFYMNKFENMNKRVFIMHHDHIERMLRHPIFEKFFNRYCHNVNHIVLAPFIKDFLVNRYSIDANKILYLPHPLNITTKATTKTYDLVGISNSNDEKIINDMIALEKNSAVLKKTDKRVILRSQNTVFDDGALQIFRGYLEEKKYYEYISSAKTILLPFPDTFKFRMSGSVVDALSNNTKVLASKIPLFLEMEKMYPNICKTVEAVDDIINNIAAGIDNTAMQQEFAKFQEEHSQENIISVLKSFIH